MRTIIHFIVFALFATMLLSCNKNAESKLYVIDSIKLGTSIKDFETQMVKKITFTQKPGRSMNKLYFVTERFLQPHQIPSYFTNSYFTTTFNDNDNGDYMDYGLLIPTYSSTKDNVIALNVIFGMTTDSFDLTNIQNLKNDNGDPIPYFVQSNRGNYIQKIKDLLIEKYGQPQKIVSKELAQFYAFNGQQLEGYTFKTNNTGNLLIWENDVVKIKFFDGIDNYNYTYNPSTDKYTQALDEDRNIKKKLDSGNVFTKGFSYLSYELTDEYMKKKKLNSPNL